MQSVAIEIMENKDVSQVELKHDSINYKLKHIAYAQYPQVLRQGDIVLTRLTQKPERINFDHQWRSDKGFNICKGQSRLTVLHTNHIIHDPLAYGFNGAEIMYVVLDKPSTITHPQHASLSLSSGIYEVRHAGLPAARMLD